MQLPPVIIDDAADDNDNISGQTGVAHSLGAGAPESVHNSLNGTQERQDDMYSPSLFFNGGQQQSVYASLDGNQRRQEEQYASASETQAYYALLDGTQVRQEGVYSLFEQN